MTVQAWSYKKAMGISDRRGQPKEVEIVKRKIPDWRQERANIIAVLEKSDDYEGTYGRILKAMQGEQRQKADSGMTEFRQRCLDALTDRPQTSREVADKIGEEKAQGVGSALIQAMKNGNCQGHRLSYSETSTWAFWK